MDLNKDKRNIYTVDAESYSEYMHENGEKSRDFLSSFIKLLLLILLVVIAYFFYKIVKADLSFAEVFNKQELFSTYSFVDSNEVSKSVEKEDYVEVLAKNISADLKEPIVETNKVRTVLVAEVILEEPPSLIVHEAQKEIVSTPTVLSQTYLDRMVEELNSL